MATLGVAHSSNLVMDCDPRPSLKTKLCIGSFYIPDLKSAYKDWPDAVNTNYPQLKVALEERIERYASVTMNVNSILKLD